MGVIKKVKTVYILGQFDLAIGINGMSEKKQHFLGGVDFFYHTKSDTIQERCILKQRAETA